VFTVRGVSLLLGGLITLATTAVVQILIIPWVQRRSRLRERWEADVIKLTTLLKDKLPTSVEVFWLASDGYREKYAAVRSGKDADEVGLAKSLEAATKKWDKTRSVVIRIAQLRLHVARVHHRAETWSSFDLHVSTMLDAVRRQHPVLLRMDDEAGVRKTMHDLSASQFSARLILDRLSATMKPPRQTLKDWQRHREIVRSLRLSNQREARTDEMRAPDAPE
jgi:hypothetical protein